jgi:hypothetical protein
MQLSIGSDGVTATEVPEWPRWIFTVGWDGSIKITPPPGATINARTWRRLPIHVVIDAARRVHSEEPFLEKLKRARAGSAKADLRGDPLLALLVANAEAPTARRGRPPSGATYEGRRAAVAAIYRTALRYQVKPGAAIETYFGVAPITVERWIADARRHGLLGSYTDEMAAADEDARAFVEAEALHDRMVERRRRP